MAGITTTIKKVAQSAIEGNSFCDIGFGTVVSEDPLVVSMETDGGKMELRKEHFLHIAQHLTD